MNINTDGGDGDVAAVQTTVGPELSVAELLHETFHPETGASEPGTIQGQETPPPGGPAALGDAPVTPAEGEAPVSEDEAMTLAQLAEELGVDAEELYGVSVGIDGSRPMSISELKDFYQEAQKNGPAEDPKQRAEFERERQDFARQKHAEYQRLAVMQQGMSQAPAVLQQLQSQMGLVQQIAAGTDWVKLEEEDAGGAALTRQKLQEQMQTLQQQYGAVQSQLQGVFSQTMEDGRQQMFADHPEWNDKAVYSRDRQNMVAYAAHFGISTEEVGQIMDPRIVRILNYSARQYAAGSAANLQAAEVRRGKSPTLRTGTAGGRKLGKRAALKELIRRGKESNDVQAQIAAVSGLLQSHRK